MAITKEEALQKGFLEDRKIFIRPIPRQGKMIKDPNHVGYFMYDGAKASYPLPMNDRGELVDIFDTDEERKYFEDTLSENLSVHSKESNYWKDFYVTFIKNSESLKIGDEYDLSKPKDNLRYRVWKAQAFVAPNWESRFQKPYYKFAIVDQNYEIEQGNAEMDQLEQIWTKYGEMKNSPKKMREFLEVYFATYRNQKVIPDEVEKDTLINEIKKIIDTEKGRFLMVINDENYLIKVLINKAIKCGAITKDGTNRYTIVGEQVTHTLPSLTLYLVKAKEMTDDVYFNIEHQIKMAKL